MQERCRVLIADDNERARRGLEALLGVRQEIDIVGEATDGLEAMQLVRECQPDVVLMDARMPHMDGLEATRQIKDRWPEIRVIVVSMYATHRTQALAAGAERFLSKGCPVEELVEAIVACCQMERVQQLCSSNHKEDATVGIHGRCPVYGR